MEATRTERLRGVWITQGRLGQLIGLKEAQLAIEEEWWATKPGKGSQVLVYYTEQSDEADRTRTISKAIKGGCQVDVEQGRNMLADAATSSFSQAFTGEEEEEELLDFGAANALTDTPGSSSTGMAASAATVLKKPAAAEKVSKLTKAEKEAKQAAEKQQREQAKKDKLAAEEVILTDTFPLPGIGVCLHKAALQKKASSSAC